MLRIYDKVDTRTLLLVYDDFKSGNVDRMAKVTKDFPFLDPKTITLAKRLAALSKEMDDEPGKRARINIEKFCENLEKELLQGFDTAFKNVHTQEMQKIAGLLFAFNGANSCVQMFISQNPFFLNQKLFDIPNAVPANRGGQEMYFKNI